MAKLYYNRILADPTFTIDDVPERWKAQVQALLEEDKTSLVD